MFTSYKKLILIIIFPLFFYGCSSTQNFHYKDGRVVNLITCSGSSWTPCYRQAGLICESKGYEIIDRLSTRSSGILSSTEQKELIFICKTSATNLPTISTPQNITNHELPKNDQSHDTKNPPNSSLDSNSVPPLPQPSDLKENPTPSQPSSEK